MRKLSKNESRELIYSTWIGFLLSGILVGYCVNPIEWTGLILVAVFIVFAELGFYIDAYSIPVELESDMPVIFLPTAFFALLGAIVLAIVMPTILNGWSIGLATVSLISFIAVISESNYADYSWLSLKKYTSLFIVARRFFCFSNHDHRRKIFINFNIWINSCVNSRGLHNFLFKINNQDSYFKLQHFFSLYSLFHIRFILLVIFLRKED